MLREQRKIFQYFYSFLQKGLVHVNLQLLYDCNFKCDICDFWKTSYKDYPRLSIDQVKLISEKLKHFGPQIISIGGGEPLIHNNLVEITNVLSENNFPVMISNGWYVTPENAKSIFNAGMYEVSISVDYISPEKHDTQRQMDGSFDRAIKALKVLNENRSNSRQRVHMISVVMDDNIEDIEPLIQLSEKIGITYLVTFYSSSRGKKSNRYAEDEIANHLLKLKRKYKSFVAITDYLSQYAKSGVNGKPATRCYAGKNLLNINSQGDITYCIDRLDEPLGNIFSDTVDQLNQKILNKHNHINKCNDCWTSCRGNIESIMYGKKSFKNYYNLYEMTKRVPLS